MRQVNHRPADLETRAAHLRDYPPQRGGSSGDGGHHRGPAGRAARIPESLVGVEPPQDRQAHPDPAPQGPRPGAQPGRANCASRAVAGGGGALARLPVPLSERHQRRRAAAGDHRQGARRVPRRSHPRRTYRQPRRERQGQHHQPADRTPSAGEVDLPVHHPRDRHRQARERSDRGDVSRADRGTGTHREDIRGPPAPVHAIPPRVGAGGGSRTPVRTEAYLRRGAVRHRPTVGMHLPYALPVRLRPLPRGDSRSHHHRTRSPGRVPPGGRHRRGCRRRPHGGPFTEGSSGRPLLG